MADMVVVAMSGGVDSSVAALLLKEKGYRVVGVTMQIWPEDQDYLVEGGCCSLSAVHDARRVADLLDIPYYVMNFRDLFEEKVIENFTEEYTRGRTPNPCIACNRWIKFDGLLQKARALGADYVATGHYARIRQDGGMGRFLVYRAEDRRKDQTYVLYPFTQDQLAHTLLPLGGYTKEEVRRLASASGLPVAEKAESQEICFVPDDDYRRFLKERTGHSFPEGLFLSQTGEVLGTHKGIPFYTVGQRKGLGIAAGHPLYVVDIDMEKNAVILGREEELYRPGLVAGDMNFIPFDSLKEPLKVEAKIRYAATPAPATIWPVEGGRVEARFDKPQRAITPGQSVVFYQGDMLVGGGIIEQVLD